MEIHLRECVLLDNICRIVIGNALILIVDAVCTASIDIAQRIGGATGVNRKVEMRPSGVTGVTHSTDASTLADTAVDIGATSEICQVGVERVNSFAIESVLNDNVVTVATAIASVNNGTIGGSTDYLIGADHIDACVVGSALGCHGRTVIIEGLRNTVAIGVFLHRPLPEIVCGDGFELKSLGIGFIARPNLDIGTVVGYAAVRIQIVAQSRADVEITATGILQIPLLCIGAIGLVLLHILAAFGFAVGHIQCLAGLRIDDCVPATVVISRSKDLSTTAVAGPQLDICAIVLAAIAYIQYHIVVQAADDDVLAIGNGLNLGGSKAAQSQLIANARNLVVGSGRNRIDGGMVSRATHGMITEHNARVVLADTAIGSNGRSGTHTVGGVTGGTGVGADIDGCQTQNVISSEPTRAIARAARAGRITYENSLSVGGDLSDDDLILEAVDIVAGSFVGKRVVSEAVDL